MEDNLPHGLSFNRNDKALAHAITIAATGATTVRASGSNLTMTLSKPTGAVSIIIHAGALIESTALVRRTMTIITSNRAHKHGPLRILNLNVGIRVTDAAGTATTLRLLIKIQ